jgi:hypothetical protein
MTRKKIVSTILLFCVLGVGQSIQGFAQDTDVYLWEKPVVTDIDWALVITEIQILQQEIEQILTRPALAPLRMNYADLPDDGYWIYRERGRVITTLAGAYPYLTESQQQQVQQYVQTMLQAGDEAPWQSPTKDNGEGEERRLHGYAITEGRYPHFPDPGPTPTLHVLYGLWLYGDRTGDWETLRAYWDEIKQSYGDQKDVAILYGQLSGFVGMIRLAHQFGDTAMVATVEADAHAQFAAARNPETMALRQQTTTFGYFLDERKVDFFPGQPWMFLDSAPEVIRFMLAHEAIRRDAVERMTQFERAYPLWWLHQAPYFTRWTGDEGIGLSPEVFGILMPFERWMKATDPQQLQDYMRSAPVGIGDLYWIEALMTVIESVGQPCWQDVRLAEAVCNK